MRSDSSSTDPDTVRRITVRTGTTTHCGRAFTLPRAAVDPAALADAIRASDGRSADRVGGSTDAYPRVDCPAPGPVHERVGYVHPDGSVRVPTALATAARSRGLTAPGDERCRRLRAHLDAMPVPTAPDTADLRRRLADLDGEIERLRERVATLRGRVQERRDAGGDVETARATLAETVADLSERETERATLRERLDAVRERAATARDARNRRRELADRLANCERAARAHLVERIRPEFERAVAAAPGGPSARRVDDPASLGPVTAALGVVRVATVRAPVVLASDRFPDAAAASDWLGAPVVRFPPPES